MALVPFRVSGAAASQQLSEQLLQIGPYSLLLHQRPKDSGNTAHLQCAVKHQQDQQHAAAQAEDHHQHSIQQADMSHVGLVLWQSGYVLSDFLLLRWPQLQAGRGSCNSSSWAGVRVLELGCGAGTVGMFLALVGAQVVITDQQHILPLTLENLELNFPQTIKQLDRTVPSDNTGPEDAGQKEASKAAADQQAVPPPLHPLHASAPAAPSLSVDAALAAAFCGAAAQAATTEAVNMQQQLQQAFSSGPLVVKYTWGEAAQVLQHRVAVAAAARVENRGCTDNVASTVHSAGVLEPTASRDSSHAAQQQQHSGILVAGLLQPACYDMVVGADLLYDSGSHAALLDSLQEVCAAHTQVFLCYRHRGLGEKAFEVSAAALGWAVEHVPPHLLHPEYHGSDYRLIHMSKT